MLVNSGYFVLWQELPQRRRSTLIEEDVHLRSGKSTSSSMLEHGARLL